MLESLNQQLLQGHSLDAKAVSQAVKQLVEELVSPEIKAEFLTTLARKGETVEEIAAFVQELRTLSVKPSLPPEMRQRQILDVCGTGGDHLNTFNISTTVALMAASAGVIVAKHGNRAITSQSGSADVLEALGIPVSLEPEEAVQSLQQHSFAFFFAQKYHPAFKHIAPARKLCAQQGQRTIFNFLGPLLNPVQPTAQLIGVPRPELCEPMARVLQSIGVRRGMVVCGKVGEQNGNPVYLDELSTLGKNTVAEFYQDRGFSLSTFHPEDFPLHPVQLKDLQGGDAAGNAGILKRLLEGKEIGPKQDAVLLNTAAALLVADQVKTLNEGWAQAEKLIQSRKALSKLEALVRH